MRGSTLTSLVTLTLVLLLSSLCRQEEVFNLLPLPTPTPTITPTPTPPPPPDSIALAFLKAWEVGDYAAMYHLTSSQTKATISEEQFIKRYQDISAEATITSLSIEITSIVHAFNKAYVGFNLTLETMLLGQVQVKNNLPLSLQEDSWWIDWSPLLIFPELRGDNFVHMFRHIPVRANIYDRNGQPLAVMETVVTVGVVPGQIEDETRLLEELSAILEMDGEAIKAKYVQAGRPDWFMPIKDIPLEVSQANAGRLAHLPGVAIRQKGVRHYPNGPLAAHLIGYLGTIDAEELAQLSSEGYQEEDMLGKVGLEKWGEQYLSGRIGGALTILTPDGQIAAIVKDQPESPGRDIYTTLDLNLQRAVEAALGQQVGAVVVLDPRNGEILALASYPSYDPNTLTTGLTAEELQNLLSQPGQPLLNRATHGALPTGSVFKIVTMAAGLEKGGYAPQSGFSCAGVWYGLGEDTPLYDWTDHGNINLVQGLVQSCNVTFYTVGKTLHELDATILPDFARQFGLGVSTGAVGLEDASGLVPDPLYTGDAVNLAIGQGELKATPLQVANLLAAVGNGGTLYRPRLVSRIAAAGDQPEEIIGPEVIRVLPLSEGTLEAIRSGLEGVTSTAPGTAYRTFKGFGVPVAGKTGTAQNPGESHAWFAAYAPAHDPRIALAVVIEHGGEGSKVAAPIARQILENFFAIGRLDHLRD
ncbi:MAG: penicillin-binding protein 2 [Anaerolineae bacterium]